MIKRELKRNIVSYATLSLVAAIISTTIVSYYFSLAEKSSFIGMLDVKDGSVNFEVIKAFLDNMTGPKFLFSYYWASDEFNVGIILIFAWLGIFCSSQLFRQKENGFGNFILMRMDIKKYINQMIVSQSFYIIVVFGIIFSLQLLLACIVSGKLSFQCVLGEHYYGGIYSIFLIFLQYILVSIYCILINAFSEMIALYMPNIYAAQMIPVVLFALCPLVFGYVFQILFPISQDCMNVIDPFMYLTAVFRIISVEDPVNEYADLGISIGMLTILSLLAKEMAIKKLQRQYI